MPNVLRPAGTGNRFAAPGSPAQNRNAALPPGKCRFARRPPFRFRAARFRFRTPKPGRACRSPFAAGTVCGKANKFRHTAAVWRPGTYRSARTQAFPPQCGLPAGAGSCSFAAPGFLRFSPYSAVKHPFFRAGRAVLLDFRPSNRVFAQILFPN